MKKFKVIEIEYDVDGEDIDINDLPTTLTISVPNSLTDNCEIYEYISDKISDITGFTHNGFSTIPNLLK